MSNQAIYPVQERLGLNITSMLVSALELQANGAAAQGVDSGQAAQDLHASVQSANNDLYRLRDHRNRHFSAIPESPLSYKIGRASCRERV